MGIITILIASILAGGIIALTFSTVIVVLESQAAKLLEELNEEASTDAQKVTHYKWNYNMNMTDENLEKLMAAQAVAAEHRKDAWKKTINLPLESFANYSLKRQLGSYTVLGSAALSNEKFQKLSETIEKMQTIYSTAKVCPKNSTDEGSCTLSLDPELTDILATSTDPEELEHVWLKWRDAVGPKCRLLYKDYVDLSNEVAILNGCHDMSEFWLEEYEDPDFSNKIDSIWEELKPFYQQLHAYIRTKLREKYGNIVSADGPIPAHLLGNMWGQSWSNIAEFTLPHPDVVDDVDVTEKLNSSGYNVLQMYTTAEEFYLSINLTVMPTSFWSNSILVKPEDRNITCHATAWDFSDGKDFRISHCATVTAENFETAHHEMGHIEYYIQYKDQPFPFRSSPNDGFHEALGDLITLSVQSTKHLKKIGLYDSPSNDPKAILNNLFRLGLTQVAFLPFSYLTDLWRWGVFSGKIKFEDYNCKWWELKHAYQGIDPPNDRTEDDFDPAAKFHIVADVSYIRYFVSVILQYQFHKALCKIAGEYEENNPSKLLHECDIYENKEVGNVLKKMMSMGASQPWPDALEVVTGQREIDASGFIEYFKPLKDWLEKENVKNNAFIGWKASTKVCTRS